MSTHSTWHSLYTVCRQACEEIRPREKPQKIPRAEKRKRAALTCDLTFRFQISDFKRFHSFQLSDEITIMGSYFYR